MMPISAMRLRTPPSAPVNPIDPNIISLCHYEGAPGSTAIVDQVPARTWTASGVAAITNAQAKFGNSSCVLGGSQGGLASNTVPGTNFGTGDFTIEFWIRRDFGSGARYVYDGRSAQGAGIALYFLQSGVLQTQASANTASSISVPIDTWAFVAASRSGTVLRTFINGSLASTQTDARNYTAGEQIFVGQTYARGSTFFGFIDELRVTRGVARYTADFIPPSAPFPNS